jgi:predicted RNA methylase
MARLASIEKGGFYPTPPEEVALICSRLKAENPEAEINILDPCCGEGVTLEKVAKALGTRVTTYGIELEETRAQAAKKRLNRAIHSAYEDAEVTPFAFSFLWLNPPYMELGNKTRAEIVFLRDLTASDRGKLQPGGLLGYCIPTYVLKDAATLLAVRFENIKVYRFTKKNFPSYKQIVVFGYRRRKVNTRPQKIANQLKALSEHPNMIPFLDVQDNVTFTIPASRNKVKTFCGSFLEPEEVLEAVKDSPAWEDAEMTVPAPRRSRFKSPVLPLKPAHIALAIVAGAVGGNMGTHLLVGKAEKVVDTSTITKKERTLEIQTERYVTAVRAFTPQGIFELKQQGGNTK